MWSYAYAVSYIRWLAEKTKHVRNNKLGETRQIRECVCDVIGTLEDSCRSRIKLCFAMLSYPMLSYPIIPARMPFPVGLGITMLLHLEIVSEERQNGLSNASNLQPVKQQAEARAQITLATAACINALHGNSSATMLRTTESSFIRSVCLPSFPPSLPASRQNAHPPVPRTPLPCKI